MRPTAFALAACLLAAPAAAQKAPMVYDWHKEAGWSAEADGISHSSGLKCPSSVWKGLDETAPVGFDSDSFGDVPVDAACQYYTYWDATLETETRLVVNIVKTPNPVAYIEAWGPQMFAFRAPEQADSTRGGTTYQMVRWQDDTKHVGTFYHRSGEAQGLVIQVVQPFGYDEDKVWAIVEALYRANS